MPFQEGHPQMGGIKKGDKHPKTIAREKARAVFEEAQLKRWLNISNNLATRAENDQKAAEYAVNQVIGKAQENIKLNDFDINLNV